MEWYFYYVSYLINMIIITIKSIISEITDSSSEVLFEVWDQGQKIGKSDAFLGLAIGKYSSPYLPYIPVYSVCVRADGHQ